MELFYADHLIEINPKNQILWQNSLADQIIKKSEKVTVVSSKERKVGKTTFLVKLMSKLMYLSKKKILVVSANSMKERIIRANYYVDPVLYLDKFIFASTENQMRGLDVEYVLVDDADLIKDETLFYLLGINARKIFCGLDSKKKSCKTVWQYILNNPRFLTYKIFKTEKIPDRKINADRIDIHKEKESNSEDRIKNILDELVKTAQEDNYDFNKATQDKRNTLKDEEILSILLSLRDFNTSPLISWLYW